MIPLRLTLKNFLCYGEGVPTLDLEGIHVACLCGQNGHGKSALLDAITWALWGRGRGKSQDDLIHYGHDEMLVELEFLARDTRYRVTRRHASGAGRSGHGATDLQFQMYTGEGFHPITGNSIRDTQGKIDQTIGMDYDTFINSAFLLQGRADEFTNKGPGERKEVLAKILGLGIYDRLQDRVKEYADERKKSAASVEGELERMRREVSRRDGYSSELEVVDEELKVINGRMETSQQTLGALKLGVDGLTRKRGELEELKVRLPAIEEDISHLQREMDSRQGHLKTYQSLIEEKVTIERGMAQFQELRHRYEELNRGRERFDHLMKGKADLERTVETTRAKLEEQIEQLKRRIEDDLRPRAEAVTALIVELEEGRVRLNALAKEEQDIASGRQHVDELATRIGQLEAISQQLKAEGQELRSKLNLVRNSHQGARCPLCLSELGAQGCQLLSENYGAQIKEKLRLFQEHQEELNGAEEDKRRWDQQLPSREAALRRSQREAQTSIAVLERQLDESHKAGEDLGLVSQELAHGNERLEHGSYATGDREQLVESEERIKELGYDPDTHRRLYDEMKEVQHFEERHRRLEEAAVNLPGEQESLARERELYRHLHEDLLASRAKQQDIEAEVAQLPEWEERLRGAGGVHHKLESRHKELFRRQVELEGDLKKLEVLDTEIDKNDRVLVAFREEEGIYRELVEAFGRRGIQAMLIETILPSLEEEANGLLGRMTDNRMHLKLESQRERKSRRGEPVETLEIKISDEMGPRSYELFSGGEAFRINLALRIALSKVLAHRRGAPLPTLFIDEGFGTQDTAGRERILDVISAIEGDFQKIIVITHLDELKEAFQARIEVQKEGAGSTFWVSY